MIGFFFVHIFIYFCISHLGILYIFPTLKRNFNDFPTFLLIEFELCFILEVIILELYSKLNWVDVNIILKIANLFVPVSQLHLCFPLFTPKILNSQFFSLHLQLRSQWISQIHSWFLLIRALHAISQSRPHSALIYLSTNSPMSRK